MFLLDKLHVPNLFAVNKRWHVNHSAKSKLPLVFITYRILVKAVKIYNRTVKGNFGSHDVEICSKFIKDISIVYSEIL